MSREATFAKGTVNRQSERWSGKFRSTLDSGAAGKEMRKRLVASGRETGRAAQRNGLSIVNAAEVNRVQ
jgi:hypothetical protein